jgi:histidine triad (HIT) family protein
VVTPEARADCLFCRIVAGDIPSTMVHQDDAIIAFRDINPQAPTHILVIPRDHIASADDLTRGHAELLGRIFEVAAQLAASERIASDGYRIVTNIGRNGGQSVDHLHFHLLGGRRFTWPPG